MVEKIVITGGPCTGKTSLLKELKRRGYTTLPEVARQFIKSEQYQAKRDPHYVPLLPEMGRSRDLFQEVLHLKQERLESRVKDGRVFLDRSLVDIAAYGGYWNPFDQTPLCAAIKRAEYTQVFLLDQVPYKRDSERKETKEEAHNMHEAIRVCYERYGFKPIAVPLLPIKQRADFVVWQLKGGKK